MIVDVEADFLGMWPGGREEVLWSEKGVYGLFQSQNLGTMW